LSFAAKERAPRMRRNRKNDLKNDGKSFITTDNKV